MAVKKTRKKKVRVYNNLKGPGPGRPKGLKNKATILREDLVKYILEALKGRGGVDWLKSLDDKDFIQLLKTAVPRESKIEVSTSGKVLDAMLARIGNSK